MERLTIIVLLVVLAAAGHLIIQSSGQAVERLDHWCGPLKGGTYGQCDPGRCCSTANYCGVGEAHCSPPTCSKFCPPPPPVPPPRGGAKPTSGGRRLVGVVKAVTNNINASSSSSSSSPLSCATSLSSLPLSSLHKYPWAAFRVAVPQTNNKITTTNCGRCLKVTNLGAGGVHPEVKVRVVHEGSNEGLELDLVTFIKLDTDGHGSITGRLFLKYQFESC